MQVQPFISKMLIQAAVFFFGYALAEPFIGPRLTVCNRQFGILSSLGKGSFGRVFKAQDLATDDVVAIKILKADSRKQMILYKREVGAMERLKGRRHVVKLECEESRDSMAFIVMEFCNEGNLRQSMKDLTRSQALTYWNQMATGLEDIHKNGIFHRDIKPENVFLHNNELKIGDFGLATKTGTHQGLQGSKGYAAPEVLASKSYDESADLWSTGILFYEVFQKEHPYYKLKSDGSKPSIEEVEKEMKKFIHKKYALTARMSPQVGDILYNLVHKTPSSRRIVYATDIPTETSVGEMIQRTIAANQLRRNF